MPSVVEAAIARIVRQSVLGLAVAMFAVVALAFLTAGGWVLLAQSYGAAVASFALAAIYAVAAMICVIAMRSAPRPKPEPQPTPATIDLGLALGSSFFAGFRAGRRSGK